MQLTTTSKYAIRIMSFMANNSNLELFNAKKISQELNIPYKFMSKIMSDLAKANLIISIRGRDGGYKLAKEASQIKIIEILNVFDGFAHREECILGIGKCDGINKCSLHDQWYKPKQLIIDMFENTTLENLEGQEFKI